MTQDTLRTQGTGFFSQSVDSAESYEIDRHTSPRQRVGIQAKLDGRSPVPNVHSLMSRGGVTPAAAIHERTEGHDDGRSPSPEPCRNYSDVDSGSQTSEPTSTRSSRSERVRQMTQRIEYLHSRYVPEPPRSGSEVATMTSLLFQGEKASPTKSSTRPKSPPGPCAPIPRHHQHAEVSVPRVSRSALQQEQCLRQINESLDELRELLPQASQDQMEKASKFTSGNSTGKTVRRSMRIKELCGKLDILASAAHDLLMESGAKVLNASQESVNTRVKADASRHLLEEVIRKIDSLAFLIEQLESTPPPSRGQDSRSSRSTPSQQQRLTGNGASPKTVGEAQRSLLQEKHTETVMDTLEMLANAVCGLADRVETHHHCLEMIIQAQKEQLEAYEEQKMDLPEMYPTTARQQSTARAASRSSYSTTTSETGTDLPRAAEFPVQKAVYSEGSEEEEEGYVERSQLSRGSHKVQDFLQADRHSIGDRSVSNSQNSSTVGRLEDLERLYQQHQSIQRARSTANSPALNTSASPSRRVGPHRHILTPAQTAGPSSGTTTDALMTSMSAIPTEAAKSHYSAHRSPRVGVPTTERPVSQSTRTESRPASADVSRSLFVESKKEATADADVSRSLFLSDHDSSVGGDSRSDGSERVIRSVGKSKPSGHIYTAPRTAQQERWSRDATLKLQDIIGHDKLRTVAERKASLSADESMSARSSHNGSQARRQEKLKKMYVTLRNENVSLKNQLEAALEQKDHWRQLVEETLVASRIHA